MRARLSDTSDVPAANKLVVETVVQAVASVEGVDPVDLSDPVFAFLDPDALDALVTSASAGTLLTVTFQAWGHDIVVDSDGDVFVDGELQDQAPIGDTVQSDSPNYR